MSEESFFDGPYDRPGSKYQPRSASEKVAYDMGRNFLTSL